MKPFLSAVVAATLALCVIEADAGTAPGERRVALRIESTSLATALDKWAQQSGFQIFVDWEIIRNLTAPAVVGTFKAQEALEQLLAGTQLTHVWINDKAVSIRKKAASPRTEDIASGCCCQASPAMWRLACALSGAEPPCRPDMLTSTACCQEAIADKGLGGDDHHYRSEAATDEGVGDTRVVLLVGCPLDLALVRAEAAGRAQPDATANAEQKPPLIGNVIVTAQKRAEALQDVPISISVLSGAELDKGTAQGMLEVLNRTPGVAMYGTDRPFLAIRGVTAGSVTAPAGSSPVAYYLDTLPFSLARNAIVPDAETYDLERVEVLRGPQGTLYGANAQVGVVRVLTHTADLDDFEIKGRTAFSSTEDGGDNIRGDAAINVPIVPGKLAVRGVVSYQDLSGWIDKPNKKDINDAEIRTARLKADARPTDEFSIGLSGWSSRSDFGAPPNSDDNRQHASLIDEPLSEDYDLYGMTLGYDFSTFSVSSMTGYLDYEHTDVRDHRPTLLSAVPVPRLATTLNAHTFSQEIVATANVDSVWRWTLGGMYRDSTDRLRQNSLAGGIPFDFSQGSESYAVFGEFGRRFFGEKLGWTIGLRSFHDEAFINENVNQGPPGSSPIRATASSEATTPRVVLSWYPSADLTLYTSYSEGFRSGFPQNPSVIRTLPTFPPLKPDELRNYELGFKAILFDGRLSLDTAAFYIDWRDTQQSLSIFNGSVPVAAQVNSKSASGPGFELALTARPGDSFELSASFGWNDLTFDEDVSSRGIVLFPKGVRLNGSPEYTAGLGANYIFALGGGGFEGRLSASGNYISSRADRFLLGTTVLSTEGDNMLITRASFAVDYRDRWTAAVFVDNLNDEDGASVQSVLSPFWASRVRPRTVGLQFEFNFR